MRLFPFVIIYLSWVLASFFILPRLTEDLRSKCPSLMDKRWKRILWLLSCLLLIPIFLIPLTALDAVKEFISGEEERRKEK
jgi:hypothetical protein